MEKSADHHKTSHACSGGAATEKWEEVSTAFRTAETMLRLAPVGLCLAALVITLKDSQNNEFGSVSYSNLSAFWYVYFLHAQIYNYSNLLSSIFRVTYR